MDMMEHRNNSPGPVMLDLPNDIVDRICRNLDVPDLLSMEKTCKRFHLVLSDDLVWSGQSLGEHERTPRDDRLPTFRENQCARHNIHLVRRYQRSTDNFFVNAFQWEFPCESWRGILEDLLLNVLPLDMWAIPDGHLFLFRGDTLCTVLELLQSFLVVSFQRALRVCLVRSEGAGVYPIVTQADLKEQEMITLHDGALNRDCRLFCKDYTQADIVLADIQMELDTRDELLRRIAYQAGIPRLDNDIYPTAWTATMQYARILVSQACRRLCDRVPLDADEPTPAYYQRGKNLPWFVMKQMPPPPTLIPDDTLTYLHKPTPSQIEDVAKEYFPHLPNRVYGFWIADCPEHGTLSADCDEEMKEAMDDYPVGDDFSDGEYESGEETYNMEMDSSSDDDSDAISDYVSGSISDAAVAGDFDDSEMTSN